MKTDFEWNFENEAKKLRALNKKLNSDIKSEKQVKLINNQSKRKEKWQFT